MQPRVEVGRWKGGGIAPATGVEAVRRALHRVDQPCWLVAHDGLTAAASGGTVELGASSDGLPLLAALPAAPPASLGDPRFRAAHGLRFACSVGAMYHGIASVELVVAAGRAGLLGVFGAGGLAPAKVEEAIVRVQEALGDLPFGFNLLASPAEPELEAAVVETYLRRGVRRVCAAAYVDLTLPLVRFRVHGIRRLPDGRVETPNQVLGKLSRIEVAAKFFAPPPERLLAALVERGELTPDQAAMAATVPMAQDVTAEADSGGHTDNQPFVTMLPTMLALRDEVQARQGYAEPLRVGAAGGVATPAAVAAAFAMGAAYVMTGSVNQSCREAGMSAAVKRLLCAARQGDVAMAPAADMFELGARVQVLKRGTMFPMRAQKLGELFKTCARLEDVPSAQRASLERDLFRANLDDVWRATAEYFKTRDPAQVDEAERDPKHKLALVFRWYLGQSSRWAESGEPSRVLDYQVQCGPAMGAFNEWARGSFLEGPEERRVALVNANLMAGGAIALRLAQARLAGVDLPREVSLVAPRRPAELGAEVDPDVGAAAAAVA